MQNRLPSGVATRAVFLGAMAVFFGCGGDTTESPPAAANVDLVATVAGPAGLTAEAATPDTLRVTIQNKGTASAHQVTARLGVSSGTAVLSVAATGNLVDGAVTWAVGDIAAGHSVQLTAAIVSSDTTGISVNASATAAETDHNPADNNGSVATRLSVAYRSDLFTTVSAPAWSKPGVVATYSVSVGNRGPSRVSAPRVDLQLPSSVVPSALPANVVTLGNGHLQWTPPSMNAGDTQHIDLLLKTPNAGPVTLVASASSASTDPESADNQAVSRTFIGWDTAYVVQQGGDADQFGWEMEQLPDLDGDGRPEFAVSAIKAGVNGAGAVYIFSGRAGTLMATFRGNPGDGLGNDLELVGDLNGDAVPELAAGAPGADVNHGRVYIYDLKRLTTLTTLTGEGGVDQFGSSIGPAGDVDDDGVPDLIAGAPSCDAGAVSGGCIYIISGADFHRIRRVSYAEAGAHFGQAAHGIGDVDHDGVPDQGVGAPQSKGGRGAVILISGKTGNTLREIEGPDANGQLGQYWISTPGDYDGDGTPDIFASALTASHAYVFSGESGEIVRTMVGDRPGDQFGVGHPAGDIDGDGVVDLVIAAWLSNESGAQAGKIFVISGKSGSIIRTMTGPTANERLGFDVVAAGDMTGDGIGDFLVSGFVDTGKGRVYLIPGVKN